MHQDGSVAAAAEDGVTRYGNRCDPAIGLAEYYQLRHQCAITGVAEQVEFARRRHLLAMQVPSSQKFAVGLMRKRESMGSSKREQSGSECLLNVLARQPINAAIR